MLLGQRAMCVVFLVQLTALHINVEAELQETSLLLACREDALHLKRKRSLSS